MVVSECISLWSVAQEGCNSMACIRGVGRQRSSSAQGGGLQHGVSEVSVKLRSAEKTTGNNTHDDSRARLHQSQGLC